MTVAQKFKFPPWFTSGTIPTRGASSEQGYWFIETCQSFLTSLTSSGGRTIWNAHVQDIKTLSGDPYADRLWWSRGNPDINNGSGDCAVYIRISQSAPTAMSFRAYTSFSIPLWSGTLEPEIANSTITTLNNSSSIEYHVAATEYDFALFWRNSFSSPGTTNCLTAGSTLRSHIPKKWRGTAFVLQNTSPGTDVVLNLDRDMLAGDTGSFGNWEVGQPIEIFDIMPISASSYISASQERTYITAIGNSTVTLANLTSSHYSGAIVGLDPLPNFYNDDTFGTCYFCYNTQLHGTGTARDFVTREGAILNDTSCNTGSLYYAYASPLIFMGQTASELRRKAWRGYSRVAFSIPENVGNNLQKYDYMKVNYEKGRYIKTLVDMAGGTGFYGIYVTGAYYDGI